MFPSGCQRSHDGSPRHRKLVAEGTALGAIIAPWAAAPTFYAEQHRLLEEFVMAVSEYLRSESVRTGAWAKGGESLFDDDLEAARKRKEGAKEAIRAHQKEHGC